VGSVLGPLPALEVLQPCGRFLLWWDAGGYCAGACDVGYGLERVAHCTVRVRVEYEYVE
jgi:hypothetical protein